MKKPSIFILFLFLIFSNLYSNNSIKNTGISLGTLEIKEEKASLKHYMFWWDDEKKEGLFRHGRNASILLRTKDFVNFEQIYKFNHIISSVRPTSDGKYLVCVNSNNENGKDPNTDPSLIEGVYKGDENGFDKKITWSTSTACQIEHWSPSIVSETILLNEYDASPMGKRQTTCAYISTDAGDTFTKIFDFHASDFYQKILSAYPTQDKYAHIHGCCYDPYENRAWLATGDGLHKWVLYSEPLTDLNNVVWKGMYLETQFCPLYATPNGIIAGTDHRFNSMYWIDRDYKETEYPVYGANHTAAYSISDIRDNISHVPGIITEIDGIYYSPVNSWGAAFRNKLLASTDGLNWSEVWESENSPGIYYCNHKVFKYGDDLLLYEYQNTISSIIICSKSGLKVGVQQTKEDETINISRSNNDVTLTNLTDKEGSFQLYDLTGSLLQNGILNIGENILKVSNGIYIVKVTIDGQHSIIKF